MTELHYYNRKTPRATFHDYSCGTYFVTICTQDKEQYFGYIADGRMNLSAIGRYASEALSLLPNHYSYLEVLQFVVMPNHIHAILSITESDTIPQSRERLGVVIGGFKQSVTMFARKNNLSFEWQKRYHDHIIRDVHDGNRIADYIDSNVAKWSSDCFY